MDKTIIPLILAAGKSSRFKGSNKLLYRLEENPLILETLNPFIDLFEIIIVVLGYDSVNVKNILEKKSSKIRFVINTGWEKGGMSSSIKNGLSFITNNYDCLGTLIHPGDIPYVTMTDLEKIFLKIKDFNYQKIVIPQHENKNGHPIFIPRDMFSEIFKIEENSEGLREVIKKNIQEIIHVETGRGILKDIDKRSDL